LSYQVEITNGAKHDLRRVHAQDEARILAAIRSLADEPYPAGVLKLSGSGSPAWRIRVGEYRVIFTISEEQQVVFIESVERRTSQTYRRLP
jgi:mRNA interferase RelE/StbE